MLEGILAALRMGDHGFYVWLSYAVSLVVVVANVWTVRRSRRRFLSAARAAATRRQQALATSGTTRSELTNKELDHDHESQA